MHMCVYKCFSYHEYTSLITYESRSSVVLINIQFLFKHGPKIFKLYIAIQYLNLLVELKEFQLKYLRKLLI